ncbi:WD40 repeat-like protein [Sistotremastrum suecicum HHB10207 ss-3]|uniref:WD repeat-containing protein JIP5 n=1 Tax=Sistotremastrum suecicum HHB10207 ss-3 TaxID=1314776 RepID=A0A166I655_9AGAM|nr:WD40 repeat-like protein [Sistotremastrum suecicum HHB10207 ss-3]
MPDIPIGNQVFDLVFHPKQDFVYVGTVAGEIKGFSYDAEGEYQEKLSIRPTMRSCRGLDMSVDASKLYSVGKDKIFHILDAETGKTVEQRANAHESSINRIATLNEHTIVTGDDEGVIKFWDPRKPEAIRSFEHHFDFISDFHYLPVKKQLITTSGDATVSVIDIRSNKKDPLAHSEDQEDELLSIVPIKKASRFVVGTQLGTLLVFNQAKGWADSVDRVPGHPSSVEALCPFPGADNVILTGSSDGMIRALQLYPTKLLGVIADHGEFPIERLKLDRESRWLGSVSHDNILKMTDVKDALEESDGEGEEEGKGKGVDLDAEDALDKDSSDDEAQNEGEEAEEKESDSGSDSEDEPVKESKKRKKKKNPDPLGTKKKKNPLEGTGDPSFFAGL